MAKKTTFICTVKADTLAIRNGPGTNYSFNNNASYHKNDRFYSNELVDDCRGKIWGKTDKGWVCFVDGQTRFVDYQPFSNPTKKRTTLGEFGPTGRPPEEDVVAATQTGVGAADTTNGTGADSNTQTAATNESSITSLFQTIFSANTNRISSELAKKTTRLFGLPYQFREQVDVRPELASATLGLEYLKNIVEVAPVVTIMPGKPCFAPNQPDKNTAAKMFNSALTDNLGPLKNYLDNSDGDVRYYDFESDYTNYIRYVNMMCRTAATILELTDLIPDANGPSGQLQKYDWKNYRWNAKNFSTFASATLSAVLKGGPGAALGIVNAIKDKTTEEVSKLTGRIFTTDNASEATGDHYIQVGSDGEDATNLEDDRTIDSLMINSSFVQFYVDPNLGGSDEGINNASNSMLKSGFDSMSSKAKEWGFILDSGGVSATLDELTKYETDASNGLRDAISAMGNGNELTTFMSRLIDTGGKVIRGENMIIPKIWDSSEFRRSYNIVVHLKAPYGNKYSYYMDVLVPLFHLLALALPKQATANSYGAPFLVKCFCDGLFTCNLGIVSSISIDKTVSESSWTVDGFPSEIDVRLTIEDLYSDLTMTPTNQPRLFMKNSSLIEYLSTTCGLNLTQPQLGQKLAIDVNVMLNGFGDIPENVKTSAFNFVDSLISPWISIGAGGNDMFR